MWIKVTLNEVLWDTDIIKTSICLIFHPGKYLNQAMVRGNYFFHDIKKEGIVLYDTGKVGLQNPKKLAMEKVQPHFDQWSRSVNGFIKFISLTFLKMIIIWQP